MPLQQLLEESEKDKAQDDFMAFWESKKETVGLGNYSDEITQWWFDWCDAKLERAYNLGREEAVNFISNYKFQTYIAQNVLMEGNIVLSEISREENMIKLGDLQHIITSLESE